MKIFEKEFLGDIYLGIYVLDCEMFYIMYGLELMCVIVVDMDVYVVYDIFVKFDNEIVDYNIRFLGVMEVDFVDISVILCDV